MSRDSHRHFPRRRRGGSGGAVVKRPRLMAFAAVAAAALLAGSLPSGPGATAAAPTGPGSASSRAAQVSSGQISVVPSFSLLGLNLSAVTGVITSTVVNPLLQLPAQLTASLADALTGAGLRADSGSTQQPRPTSGYPTCGQQGWTTTNCYGPVVPTIATPVLALTTGGLQGYATGDTDGYVATAHAANPVLTLLGISIGDLGVVDSTATCTTTTCSANHTLTGGSLFGGALTFGLAGSTFLAKVGNTALTGVPVTVVNGVTASLDNNLLTVKVTLSITQLLAAIGTTLSALDGLLGNLWGDNNTTATLTVTLGPGAVTADGGTQASAWGLNVGVSLTAVLRLSLRVLLNLSTLEVAVTGTHPNVADLKLAYSTATAGTVLPGWISPVLI